MPDETGITSLKNEYNYELCGVTVREEECTMHKLFQSAAAVLISFVLFGTVPTTFAETVRTNDSTYRVIGYLPDWSYQYYTKVDFSALTHLDIAFCNPDENSNISCNIPDDTLQTIINTAHQYNVKVMSSVATTVSTVTFASLIDTPEKITKLNDNLIAYCQTFGFDGIDLDVERGSTDAVWNYYGNWVSALRVECDANGLELSTATAEWTAKKISPETFACFDFVMIMAYADDSSTVSHTTLEFGQQQMNYIAQEKQVPPEKLMLGIPFYGRGYTADGKLDRSYFKTFAELIAAEPANYDRDVYNGVAYNGASTVRVKCNYAKQYGGVMIWQLAQDAAGEYSLLTVIKDEMRPKPGDINGDGICDAADAALLKDWLLCKSVTEPVKFTAGDMDADSILNAKDLTLLLRCAAA